jgi:hypothetical protein
MNMQLHLRGQRLDDVVLPTQESWSLVAAALGFTFGYAQTLTYSGAVECAGAFAWTPPSTGAP